MYVSSLPNSHFACFVVQPLDCVLRTLFTSRRTETHSLLQQVWLAAAAQVLQRLGIVLQDSRASLRLAYGREGESPQSTVCVCILPSESNWDIFNSSLNCCDMGRSIYAAVSNNFSGRSLFILFLECTVFPGYKSTSVISRPPYLQPLCSEFKHFTYIMQRRVPHSNIQASDVNNKKLC